MKYCYLISMLTLDVMDSNECSTENSDFSYFHSQKFLLYPHCHAHVLFIKHVACNQKFHEFQVATLIIFQEKLFLIFSDVEIFAIRAHALVQIILLDWILAESAVSRERD